MTISQEMYALVASKRFWAAISGLVLVILKQFFPTIDPTLVDNAVMLIAAWIIGDTVRPTNDKTVPPVTTTTEVTPKVVTTETKTPTGVFPEAK